MAQLTTNYNLYKPEATDTYNHLIYDNPNMDTIDSVMKNNSDHAVDSSTCIKSGTVHSVTRTNTSCPVFKFTATGDWNTGDTMNVDGTPVSVFLPDGSAPLTGCYVINTEVLAIIAGSRVTLMCPVIPDSLNVSYDNTSSGLAATNVQNAIDELKNDIDIIENEIEVSYPTPITFQIAQPVGRSEMFAYIPTIKRANTASVGSPVVYVSGWQSVTATVEIADNGIVLKTSIPAGVVAGSVYLGQASVTITY